MLSRRAFLAAVPAALAPTPVQAQGRSPGLTRSLTPALTPGLTPTPTPERPELMGSQFDPWIEVSAQNLRHNVAEVARLTGRPILAVIKNNGYGLGLTNVAGILDDHPRISGFAVIKLHEAMQLRDAGVRKPVLLMGPFTDTEIADAAARDVALMVYRDRAQAFAAAAAKTRRPVAVQIKIDTGMGRVGIPHEQAASLVTALARQPAVRIHGLMTTLTEDEAFDREQVSRFTSLAGDLARSGVRAGVRHAASSYALFQTADAFLDVVRPGMALLGIYPEPRFRRTRVLDLRPAVAFRARVALVKQIHPGESAGYNRAFQPAQPTWIATLPVGHADGWPRAAAKGARVRIGERLYPVVASVSASHTIVDLGATTNVAPGEVATLFDWTDGSRPEDVGEACGASVYDLTMHLSALLPRRIVA